MARKRVRRQQRSWNRWLYMMIAFMAVGFMGAAGFHPFGPALAQANEAVHTWQPFSFMSDPSYNTGERVALIVNVIIAFAGLGYALMLVKEVYRADTGTPRMQEITQAVRERADAYLKRQLTTVAVLL